MIAHTASHSLPIGNGFASFDQGDRYVITVWCGRCQKNFTADTEWAGRYLAATRRRLQRRVGQPGLYGLDQQGLDLHIAGIRTQFARAGLTDGATV